MGEIGNVILLPLALLVGFALGFMLGRYRAGAPSTRRGGGSAEEN